MSYFPTDIPFMSPEERKYHGITIPKDEENRCDTCQHEKEPWFNRCADCSDYELWENKE